MGNQERFELRYRIEPNGCWAWTGGTDPDGYGIFRYDGRSTRAHRAAWLMYRGFWPGKQHVLHTCDNPGCVNPDHLFLGNCAANMADKVRKGRQAKRESHGRARLTEEAVAIIRSSSLSTAALARQFGVAYGTVWFVRQRITWR